MNNFNRINSHDPTKMVDSQWKANHYDYGKVAREKEKDFTKRLLNMPGAKANETGYKSPSQQAQDLQKRMDNYRQIQNRRFK